MGAGVVRLASVGGSVKATPADPRARRVAASRQAVRRSISERQLQADVEREAKKAGWRYYHTLRSKGSKSGFPDLVLVRGTRIIYAELKTQRGVVSSEQRDWLDDLAGAGAEVYLWRPSDMDEIGRLLYGKRQRQSPTAWPLAA